MHIPNIRNKQKKVDLTIGLQESQVRFHQPGFLAVGEHSIYPGSYDHGMNPETEPALATDPALTGILDELVSREPIFHRPELGFRKHDDA